MKLNQTCQVKPSSPHHGGRVGYFQFYAGPKVGYAYAQGEHLRESVVLSDRPTPTKDHYVNLFVVAREDLERS